MESCTCHLPEVIKQRVLLGESLQSGKFTLWEYIIVVHK